MFSSLEIWKLGQYQLRTEHCTVFTEGFELQGRRFGGFGRLAFPRGLCVALLLAIASVPLAPAFAHGAYVPQPPIGSPGPGDGGLGLIAPDFIGDIAGSGLAVNDTTHNIYVGDTDNHRVTVFAANGSFVGAFGADVGGPGVDVCTIGCLPGTPGTSPGAFEDPTFVAVDNSASPSSGAVYVVDSATNVISKFEANGTLVASWGTGGQLSGNGSESFGQIVGIAVNPTGSLLVMWGLGNPGHLLQFADSSSFTTEFLTPRGSNPGGLAVDPSGNCFKINAAPSVQKFATDGTDIGQVTSTATPSAGLAVDSSNGELFVVRPSGEIDRYAFESSGEVKETGCTPAPQPFEGCPPTEPDIGDITAAAGLAVDSATHTVYAADPATDQVIPFALVTTPDVITKPATAIGAESATLNGEINPNGVPLTECFFEWGVFEGPGDDTYGQTVPCLDPDFEEVGEGADFEEVHADLPELDPGTTYHFQLRAANASNAPGESIPGGNEDFRTLGPTIQNESATQVTATGARISGEISPNGKATSFVVQYLTEAQFQEQGESFTGASEAPEPPATVPTFTTGTGDLSAATGTGDLSEGSSFISGVTTATGAFAVGQVIEGTGIPADTTITAIGSGTLTLSNPVTAPGTSVPLSAGSRTITGVTTTLGAFRVGSTIEGAGIPPGTTITSVGLNTLTISEPATETGQDVALTSSGPQAVSQLLSGLEPQTAYRFRLAATNADATSFGPGGKFTTFALPSVELPDNRKYEMVSPPVKTGEVIPPEPVGDLSDSCSECLPGINTATMPMQTTADGNTVLYEGQPFSGGLAAGPNEYVSGRGSTEWSWESLSTPTMTGRYLAFSSDLSQGVLFQEDPALSPLAPTQGGKAFPNLYLRDQAGGLEPLITVEPPVRSPVGDPEQEFRVTYSGANSGSAFEPELSHVIFEANDALTGEVPGIAPAAPPITEGGGECNLSRECNLYEWVEGELRLVNVLDSETAAEDAVLGAGRLLAQTAPAETANVTNAISDDGSRIFWSEEASGEVFVRVNGEETLEIPGPGTCKESELLTNRACFLTASPDGTTVLLSDGQLYELDEAGPEAYEPTANLTGVGGGFEGILGASEDLSQIYFVATSDLTGTQENANGEEADAGKLNLYFWDEGVPSFIGRLLPNDNSFGTNGRYGAWKAARPNRTAQVSLAGSELALMTRATLTGYDNLRAGGGECRGGGNPICFEVFVYEADSETLSCASCNRSGQRPLGSSNLSLLRPQSGAFRQPGNLSTEGEGRLFFESQDTLLPQDTNGSVMDVYQWEPNGVGSCEEAQGCVSLISSGRAANDSMFVDSTPSGDDAFFITRERLLLRDKDSQLDLYDARVNGGLFEPQPPICNGEACAGPIPPPPPQPSPSSQSFSGPGNPPQNKPGCKKGFVKKKGKCVKKKPKKKKKGQAKRGGSR